MAYAKSSGSTLPASARNGLGAVRMLGTLAVSGGLLYWSLHRVNFADLARLVMTADYRWLTLAYLALLVAAVIHCWRFSQLVAICGNVPFVRLLRIHFFGMFCNTFLPSELGLDAVRIHWAGRAIGGRMKMCTLVMIDRVAGALAISALSCLALLMVYSGILPFWIVFLSGTMLLASAVVIAMILWLDIEVIEKVSDWLQLPDGTRSCIVGIFRQLMTAGCGWRLMLLTSVLAAIQCTIIALSIAMTARALHLPASSLGIVAMFPVIGVAVALPISVNGLGVREAMFCLTMAPLGLDQTEAVSLAASWLLLTAIGFAPGALAMFSLPRSRGRRLWLVRSPNDHEHAPTI